MNGQRISESYKLAAERYAEAGVDSNAALQKLTSFSISLHCWQGDDVRGFESRAAELSGGGIQATGNYPGKARTLAELRSDIEQALSLVPGRHRVNLHASYLDHGGHFVDRDEIELGHFQSWIDWAKHRGIGLDFNPTYFSHPKAADGFTLAHPNREIRNFWVRHGKLSRRIAAEMGQQLGTPAITNHWIPDGYKDVPVDRRAPRERLLESLDAIFSEPIEEALQLDSVEPKLFGIGLESYTVGSFEFYLGYAASRKKLLTLDSGHFHPTESVADKISSVLLFCPGVFLHVSRPVRWDSDHVVILDDEAQAIAREVVRNEKANIHVGLDYFDASINRVAAWVIGMRNLMKAILIALLEPTNRLRQVENEMDFTHRLAALEEHKALPWSSVWDYYCLTHDVPIGLGWYKELKQYERNVLACRGGARPTLAADAQ